MEAAIRNSALRELDRFFALAVSAHERRAGTLNMPCCVVDAAWHELLQNPYEYEAFTSKHASAGIEHLPNNGYGTIDWVPAYEAAYGQLDPVWFVSESGEVDSDAEAAYRKSGTWKASWDCTPAVKVHA